MGRGFDSHRGQKIFSLPRVVPCFPLLGLTPSGLFMVLSLNLHFRVNSLVPLFVFPVLRGAAFICITSIN